jgi:S1-C subfamily serine protease
LTTFELTDIPSNLLVTYQVADYQGRTTSAYIDIVSEDYGLAVLRFRRVLSNHLPAIEFADQNSLLGEPVLLFGYIEEIMNSMSMGLVEETNSESNILDEYVYTTIESDIYANGSVVININNQLIGIQAGVSEGLSYAISITNIMEFLELYTDYHELD